MRRIVRPSLLVAAALLLVCGLPRRAPALDLIQDVSKEKAKELGIQVRLQPRERDVWVQVEYRAVGPLKEFKRADLDLTRDGKPLLSASLMPRKPSPDVMRFDFYIDPAALPDATVMVVVWSDPLTGIAYRLRMKDYAAMGK
jgi:hypothetical protein